MKQTAPCKALFANILAAFTLFFLFSGFFVSVYAQNDTGLVPCTNDCGFSHLLTLINTLIEKSIEYLVLPIFVFILLYAGYLYITAQGNPGVHAKVKGMLWKAILGLLLVLSSWLIVKMIMVTLGYDAGLRFFE